MQFPEGELSYIPNPAVFSPQTRADVPSSACPLLSWWLCVFPVALGHPGVPGRQFVSSGDWADGDVPGPSDLNLLRLKNLLEKHGMWLRKEIWHFGYREQDSDPLTDLQGSAAVFNSGSVLSSLCLLGPPWGLWQPWMSHAVPCAPAVPSPVPQPWHGTACSHVFPALLTLSRLWTLLPVSVWLSELLAALAFPFNLPWDALLALLSLQCSLLDPENKTRVVLQWKQQITLVTHF